MNGAEPASRVGNTLKGKYLLQELLGTGGMGEVYRARNTLLDREVAIKLLRAEVAKDKRVIERFMREAKAANVVRHKHIVDVLDIDQDQDGAFFIVQEYLEGEDLAMHLEDAPSPMSAERVLEILIPVAEAVGAAHAKGVVHRDLKPDNIFLALVDDDVVPKVLDFGISKMPLQQELRKLSMSGSGGAGANVKLTAAGAAMGTPAYMSPEQIRDPATVDARTDVWSLGVILYEALSGQLPFDADNLAQLFAEICTRDPVPLTRASRGTPKSLARVVHKCLNPVATARYAHAGELAEALHRCQTAMRDPSKATTSSAPPSATSRPPGSHAPTAIGGSQPPRQSSAPGEERVRQSGERELAYQRTEPARRKSSKPPSGALPDLELALPKQSSSSSVPPRRDSVDPGKWQLDLPPTSAPPTGSTPARGSPPPASSDHPAASRPPTSGAPRVVPSPAPLPPGGSDPFDTFDFDDEASAADIEVGDEGGRAGTAGRQRAAHTAQRSTSRPTAGPRSARPTSGRVMLGRRPPVRGLRLEAVRFGLGCVLAGALVWAAPYLGPARLAAITEQLGPRAFLPYLGAGGALLLATAWTLMRAAKMASFFLFAAALGQLVLVAAAVAAAALITAPGLLGDTARVVALMAAPWAAMLVPAGYGGFALSRARELRAEGPGRSASHLAAALGAVVLVAVSVYQTRPTVQQLTALHPAIPAPELTHQLGHTARVVLGARALRAAPRASGTPAPAKGGSAVAAVAATHAP